MLGLLNVNKPSGVTSRDVVDHVQRLVKPAKAGHAGTLDPLAKGVLVVCVGKATRLVEYVQQAPKEYRGVFLLGQTSDTLDVEGQVRRLADAPIPTREKIEAVLPQFVGEISQRPPAFSAVKIHGRRAYALARKGKLVEPAPRPVQIHRLRLAGYQYPHLELEVVCGGGTYIRSLGRDVAAALGTTAVMSQLERRAIGDFQVEQACTLEQLRRDTIAERLLSPRRAVAHLPTIRLTRVELLQITHGQTIRQRLSEVTGVKTPSTSSSEVAALDDQGELAAILAPHRDNTWRPARNFTSAAQLSRTAR